MNISENNIEYKGKLSLMQEGMLFHYMLDGSKNTYYNQLRFELHGKFDADMFVKAYNTLVKRHQALRTVFQFEDNQAVQIVLKEVEGRISIEDISDKSPEEQKVIIDKYVSDSIEKGVDLFNELPMKMKIFIINCEHYTVVWGSHHIIMDGWSMGIAARDIFEIYNNLMNGVVEEISDSSYSNYLKWIDSYDNSKEKKYWTEMLKDCPDSSELPEMEVKKKGFLYSRHTVKLDSKLKRQLDETARSLRITSNAFYQTVWGLLLSKYNNSYESLWGTVVSGRLSDKSEIAEMVGLTINTLPVMMKYNVGDSFKDICGNINMAMISAEMNSHVSLSDIQKFADKREIFNHALAFENLDITHMLCGLELGELKISDADIYDATSYDLVIKFEPTDIMTISFEYNSCRFEEKMISALAEDYVYLIETVLSDVSVPMNEIEILSEKKRDAQLKLVNGGYKPQNNKRTIELYKEAVEKYSDSIFAEYKETMITYAESDDISDKIALLMSKNGVKKGDVVGVNAEYTHIMPLRILALLKLGAVFLPLEMKKLTEERAKQMKEQCNMKYILGSEKFKKKYSFLNDVIYISDDNFETESKEKFVVADGKMSDAVYIIYTSGSTGVPKGAVISDLCLTDFICDGSGYQCVFGDRVAQLASYSFDASVFETYMTFIHGGTIVILPEECKEDLGKMSGFIIDKKITSMFLTTRLFNLLTDNVPECFRGLRTLATGGEAASMKHFIKASKYVGGELYNVYGPTETAVMVTAFPASEINDSETVYIGKPNPSRKFYVLDKDFHLLPLGMTGELFISGGVEYNRYISNDEMTSSKFIDDPFESGKKVYSTGDFVKLTDNGEVVFVGRKDSQVKVRGFRIELGEIEKAVLDNEDINDAVVCLSENDIGEKVIQLFASTDNNIGYDDMRCRLLKKLPEFMIPSQMFFMKELPMTVNGKFDKNTAMKICSADTCNINVPETEKQIFVANLWKDIFGIENVGIDSSFFELGGDSIKAMNLSAAFQRNGINIGLKDIFANPTIRLMSELISKEKQEKLSEDDIIGEVMTVPVQKWFSDNVKKDVSWFNQSVLLELKHNISEDIIKKAFDQLIKKHDIFRSVFNISLDGSISHEIMSEDFCSYEYSEYISNSSISDSEINSFGDSLQSTLDISSGHLINVGKICSSDKNYLIIVMHHLITDGVTWRIVLRDLFRIITSLESNKKFSSSDKYSSYKIYAKELNVSAKEISATKYKWEFNVKKNFENIPAGLRKDEKYFQVSIPAEYANEIAALSNSIRNADFSDIILSGFAVAFSEVLGIDNAFINLESHGRDISDIKHDVSDTAGWFTAIYPFELKSFGAQSIGRCIAPISMENHFFRRYSAEYGLIKMNSDNVIEPDICINYLGKFGSEISNELFDFRLKPHGRLYSPNQRSLYQMDINSAFTDDAFYIEIRYNDMVISEEKAERLLVRVKELIEEYYDELINGRVNEKVDTSFPLSSLQMAYFMGRQDIYELGGFSTHNYFEFETNADISRFEEALNKLIKNQEMLRAVIEPDGTQRIISEVKPYKINIRDISNLDSTEQKNILCEIRNEMSHAVFDVSKYPLFEFRFVKLDDTKKYLYMSYDLMILDSVSASMFIKQLIMLYNNPDKQPENHDYTYCDFITDFCNVKQGALYKTSRNYWMSKINEFPSAPVLNYKVQPSEIERSHFARVSHYFDSETYSKLKRFAENNGLTVSAVMLSTYCEILSMFSGKSQLGINLTVFNRYPFHRDINKIYGDFTSTLLLDYDRNSGNTFTERCTDIQKKLNDALENRYYDGVEFARELAKHNDFPANSAVMPVVFTSMLFEDDIYDEVEKFGELKWSIGQTPQVHLDFQAMNEKGGLRVQLDYVTELFETEYVERIFSRFTQMIQLTVDGKEPEVSALSETEILKLTEYNSTFRDYIPKNLAACFREAAEKYADNTAVSLGDDSYTYKELDRISERVANKLHSMGISEAESVAVFVHRKIETIALIIGIIKAGGCYVPILPEYPEERVKSICDTAGIKIMASSDMIDYYDESVNITEISPESKAYIIFTSGSTGKPKGVVISHSAVINTLEDINERFNVNANDRIIGLSSMCFDLSVYDIFGSLLAGAELVMIPNLYDADNIRNVLCSKEITIWNSVPSIMGICTEGTAGKKLKCDSLRLVMLSGDWIPLELPARIRTCFPKADVISLGGATEASIWSIYYRIGDIEQSWKSIPYGYPLANQKIYVLDDRRKDCPFNVEGDIYIGGAGLSDGYIGEKELTEKAFVQHPVYGRIYCTGDRGMFSSEGYVIFLGRRDNQIKIHGFRIELGEIEKAANELDVIENSAATAFKANNNTFLALYAVAKEAYCDESSSLCIDAVKKETEKASWNIPEIIKPEEYDKFMQHMDNISFNSIKYALGNFGADTSENNIIDIDEFIKLNNIKPVYRPLMCQWLESMCEHGYAKKMSGGRYIGIKPFEYASDFNNNDEVLEHYSRFWNSALVTYKNMHDNFHDILTGKRNAVELLFSNGETEQADTIYRNNPVAEYENNMVSKAVNAYIRNLKSEDKVRILEFGAGTGGTTIPVLEGLETNNIEYTFTDISYFFLNNAKKLLKDYDFINYEILNIDNISENPVFKSNSYDIIIGANVLHDAKILPNTLKDFNRLLKVNGMLIILEITKSSDMIKFSTGFLEGYSSYNDYRKDFERTLLNGSEWTELMESNGFHSASCYPDLKNTANLYRQSVISAFSGNNMINELAVIEHIKSRLPEYMVPDRVIQVDEIPLTSNGKVNKKALPVPSILSVKEDDVKVEKVLPKTAVQKKIAGIWRELFSRDIIYIDDNFSELGGDSLMSIRYVSELKENGINVSIRDIYENNTIRKLEKYISAEKSDTSDIRLIRKGDSDKSSIVFIYGGTGNSAIYDDICSHVDSKYNCFGIDYGKKIHSWPEELSIKELAERCCTLIKENVNTDEIILAGWCIGGTVAAETASQLKKDDINVSKLILMDSPSPDVESSGFTLETEKNFINENMGNEHIFDINDFNDMHVLWETVCHYTDGNSEFDKIVTEKFNSEMLGVKLTEHNDFKASQTITLVNLFRSFSQACASYKGPDNIGDIKTLYIGAASEFNDKTLKWKEYADVAYTESGISHFAMIDKINSEKIAAIINEFVLNEDMTELQQHIKDVWTESFADSAGCAIRLDTNFFDAGGDSISAIKIVAKLKKDGYEIDLTDIYMLDTIRKISDYLEGKNNE